MYLPAVHNHWCPFVLVHVAHCLHKLHQGGRVLGNLVVRPGSILKVVDCTCWQLRMVALQVQGKVKCQSQTCASKFHMILISTCSKQCSFIHFIGIRTYYAHTNVHNV